MTDIEIAFLGLGAMGSRMASRLVAAGHDVIVWNRSPDAAAPLEEQGATVAASPREASARANVVISMLRDDAASRAVWLDPENGALAGMRPGALAIESSTLSIAFVSELAERIAGAGVDFLDAPVSGSLPQAEGGQLIHLVGGEASAFERAQPVLAGMGAAQHHIGPAGSGMKMKLIVNAHLAHQLAAMADAVHMAEAMGLDVARTIDALGGMPVASPAGAMQGKMMLADQHAPLFPVSMLIKDLDYAIRTGAPVPVLESIRDRYKKVEAAGMGDLHMSALVRLREG